MAQEMATKDTKRDVTIQQLLREGDVELAAKELGEAELKYSNALKEVDDKDNHMQALCFQSIGDVYFRRTKCTRAGEDFVKAVALYNSALVRTNPDHDRHETLVHRISLTEKEFLGVALAKLTQKHSNKKDKCSLDQMLTENQSKARYHKVALQKIRKCCQQELNMIDRKFPYPDNLDFTQPGTLEKEKRRTETVVSLFKRIADKVKRFCAVMVQECVQVLGKPPCNFAVIGLGSLSREEITPYSDIEFAILIEEGKDADEDCLEYFRCLVNFWHIKVINLGETILPTLGIKSLNNYDSDNHLHDWFYDSGPRGFSFDGAMPWACKTALGRKPTSRKPWARELILSPTNMANLQKTEVVVKEGYHLADVMANVSLVTGDEGLVNEYVGKVKDMLQQTCDPPYIEEDRLQTVAVQRAIHNLTSDLRAYELNLGRTAAGEVYQVKKELYRLPSLFINGLALYHGVTNVSTWEAVHELAKKGIFSRDNTHHLNVVMAIAAELRLRTYLKNRGQREDMSVLPDMDSDERVHHIFHVSSESMVVRHFYTMRPLQNAIRIFLKDTQTSSSRDIFKDKLFFDDSVANQAFVHFRLQQYKKGRKYYLQVVQRIREGEEFDIDLPFFLHTGGQLFLHLGEHQNALSFYELCRRTCESRLAKAKSTGNRIMLLHHLANTVVNLGQIHEMQGKYGKANEYFNKAMEVASMKELGSVRMKNIAIQAILKFADVYDILGHHQKAKETYEKCLELCKDFSDGKVNITILVDLGTACHQLGKYDEAVAHYKDALRRAAKTFGPGAACFAVFSALDNLGNSLRKLGHAHEALQNHLKADRILTIISGKNSASDKFGTVWNNLGNDYVELEMYSSAIMCFEVSLLAKKRLHGENKAHRNIALTLINLGNTYQMTDHFEKSLEYYFQALAMMRKIYQGGHPHVLILLNNIGCCYQKQMNYEEAVVYFNKCLVEFSKLSEPDAYLETIAVVLELLDECKSEIICRKMETLH